MAEAVTRTLLNAARLQPELWADFLWQSGLRVPHGPLSALARTAFRDELHISESVHTVIANLLKKWLRSGSQSVSAHCGEKALNLLSSSSETSGLLVAAPRKSSLANRDYWVVDSTSLAVYTVPPGFKAVGFTFNRGATCGMVTLTGRNGISETMDMRFALHPMSFIANLCPIGSDLGEGEIQVSVTPNESLGQPGPVFWRLDATRAGARVEIGQLILLRRDWQDHLAGRQATANALCSSEVTQAVWANQIIDDTFHGADPGARSADSSSSMAVARLLQNAIETMPLVADHDVAFNQVRLMLASGDIAGASQMLEDCLSTHPDKTYLVRLRGALVAFKQIVHACIFNQPVPALTRPAQ